ncbi:MAG: hypothetical protein A2Z20_00425 [Bdellovibrionales bacterium RBG_16_40_8]|nr:MAG: hypothetical protein A2Z20_00425 [Bdellovibrionales bacterium RBG_16_40_8]
MAAPKHKKRQIFLQARARQKRIDVDAQTSTHSGLLGFYETAFRRFKTVVYLITILPIYILSSGILGIALVPGVIIFRHFTALTANSHWLIQDLVIGVCIATGYILYGISLVIIVPFINFVIRAKPKIFRGPYYSVDFLQWYMHNALTYLVRYTFLELITPTPFNLLFFRLMGMKIGDGTQINTSNISDPSLIEMGRNVTIGGSATLCAHYGQEGYLIIAPVKIGDKVTIGLKASVLGGVTIGDSARVMPHSVVLPKTVIPPGEHWGGVPAVKLR